ncbi:hypothetical protein ABK040_004486 [Willaertia magna]
MKSKSSPNPFGSLAMESVVLDDVATFKSMVKGSSRFEIQEEDLLTEKERVIRNQQLAAGDYSVSIESAGNSKFQFIFRVTTSKGSDIFTVDGTLFGRGNKSKYENTFKITEEQTPAEVELRLVNKARFWKKPSYKYHLVKKEDDEPSPTQKPNKLPSITNKKLKVKLLFKNDTTVMTIDHGLTILKLYEQIKNHYHVNDEILLKYNDDESELITIKTQEDLNHFIDSEAEKLKRDSTTNQLYRKPKLFIEEVPTASTITTSTTSPTSSTSPPTKVTKWIKGNMIGAGANGKVYLGINSETGQMMAVKELEIKTNREEVKKLMEEVELMSKFNHPHIVRYLGSVLTNKYLHIFLDYIPGGSLETLLLEFSLPENLIRKYSKQILEGLSYLHENGIVHCDIKSGNILVDERSNVYLTDFGCSKKMNSITQQDLDDKSITGTPNYIAPECIKDQNYTRAADIWSFGCTVCEMFSQNPPWFHVLSKFEQPVHPIQLMHYIMTNEDDSVEIPSNASEVAKDFIRQCLQRDPSKRPSAKQLLQHPFITTELAEERNGTSNAQEQEFTPSTTTTQTVKDETEEEYEDDGFTFEDFPEKDFSDDSDDEDLYKSMLNIQPSSRNLRKPSIVHNLTPMTSPAVTSNNDEDEEVEKLDLDDIVTEVQQSENQPQHLQPKQIRRHSSDLRGKVESGLTTARFSTINTKRNSYINLVQQQANENDIKKFLRREAISKQSCFDLGSTSKQ